MRQSQRNLRGFYASHAKGGAPANGRRRHGSPSQNHTATDIVLDLRYRTRGSNTQFWCDTHGCHSDGVAVPAAVSSAGSFAEMCSTDPAHTRLAVESMSERAAGIISFPRSKIAKHHCTVTRTLAGKSAYYVRLFLNLPWRSIHLFLFGVLHAEGEAIANRPGNWSIILY